MMYLPFTEDLVFLLLVLQSEDIELTFHPRHPGVPCLPWWVFFSLCSDSQLLEVSRKGSEKRGIETRIDHYVCLSQTNGVDHRSYCCVVGLQ